MIAPTAGRVVWGRIRGETVVMGPFQAIIAKVHDDRKVDAWFVGGDFMSAELHEGIPLVQPEDDACEAGAFCEWMPVHIEQEDVPEDAAPAAEEHVAPEPVTEVFTSPEPGLFEEETPADK